MRKKIILIGIISLLLIPRANAIEPVELFPDVQTSHDNFTAIMELVQKGAIRGFSDGTFQPNQPVTRAELLKIFLRDTLTVKDRAGKCFTDIKGDEWFARDICKAKSLSVIKGYPDGSFKPNQTIILAELLKIVIDGERVARKGIIPAPNYTEPPKQWYNPYFSTADTYNLKPDTLRNPRHIVTRAEAAEIIHRVKKFSQINKTPPPKPQFNYTLVEKVPPKIEPKSNKDEFIQPKDTSEIKSKILIAGTENNLVTRYVFETGTDSLTINNLHIENTITGSSNIIRKSSIQYNKKTKQSYFNTADELRFSQINYTIPREQTGVIEVLVDLNPLTLTNIDTGTKILLNLDLTPPTNFEATSVYSGNKYDGSILNPTPGKEMTIRKTVPSFFNANDNLNLHFGNDQTIYKFEVRAHPKGDVEIRKLTLSLTSDGIDTGINSIGKENGWRLTSNGDTVETATLTDNKLTFEFIEPMVITKSNFTTFEVIGTVQRSGSNVNSRITTSILRDENEAADSVNGDNTGTLTQVNHALNNTVWSDMSDREGEREDWTNGYLLLGLQTLQSFTIE